MPAQFAGSAEAALQVALANNRSITEDIEPGTQLIYEQAKKEVPLYFSNRPIDIITDTSGRKTGISVWGIFIDFIVT